MAESMDTNLLGEASCSNLTNENEDVMAELNDNNLFGEASGSNFRSNPGERWSESEFDDSDLDKNYEPRSSQDEDDEDDDVSVNKRIKKSALTEEKVKGKRRTRNPDSYARVEKKKLRNSGQAYVGNKGKLKAAKTFAYYNHECRYQCNKFSEEEANEIFTNFWKLGDFNKQKAFIGSCVIISTPKRKRTDAQTNKTRSVKIFLCNKQVCKEFFIKTLSISNGSYFRAISGKTSQGFVEEDKRGKHLNPHRIPDEQREIVKQHINMFPKYKSHYARQDSPHKQFLPSHLTIAKMYSCYVEFCSENAYQPVKDWLYRDIFNHQFNLSFHQPHTDTCDKCDRFDNILKATTNEAQKKKVMQERELHQRRAEKAVKEKAAAKNLAKDSNDEIIAICFDLQKTLSTPLLTTNKVYYLRTLWTYNFGVHDLGNKKASMFIWDESKACRGSCEVASCLLKFVEQLPKETKKILAFSDSCGGQNKNRNILKFWMYVVKTTQIETVEHKFLEPGHTYMECDEDFALIEKHKRFTPYVFIPDDWCNSIKETSKKFTVTVMETNDFFNFCEVDGIAANIQKDFSGKPIGWRELRWIKIEKSQPTIMQFNHHLNDNVGFCTADWTSKTRSKGRPSSMPVLLPLYKTPPKIKFMKWKNLQDLLAFIPPIHHDFYKDLLHENPPTKSTKGKAKAKLDLSGSSQIFDDDENGRFIIVSDDDDD